MTVAKKMSQFAEQSSWIRKMFEEGAKLKAEYGDASVFDFSIGNPDVPPPKQFNETLKELIDDETAGSHGYMPNGGYPFVREALAARLSKDQDVQLELGDILMTCGAAGALNVIFKALLDPGDEVIIIRPFFVDYHFYVDNHGGVVKVVDADENFNLDLGAIEAALTDRTKVVLINSPNNPTGQIYSAEELGRLGALLDKAGERFCSSIYLVSDEPYRNIVFDGHEVPALMTATTNSIVASSYSKELSIPGERIGYIALNPKMAEKQSVINALTLANRILGFINAPAMMQRAVAQLQDVSIDSTIYARRLDAFCKVLDDAGFSYERPKGAFYLFPRVPIDDVEFCSLLQEEKILAVPGRGFGMPGYIRLAFCVDEAVINKAADGFKRAMATARQQAG
ncbi:pyridoxal phosphate-dependent aminotransferase [Desulfogranum mediterraneum]|uniref:pyridoxal phosphate-dependent aminotransferase n=1 Tax=Desulfogranum mediterraneum TaxID=160661 RepID=UPI000413B0DB|nr:pyridoxal phosphate-dependent aminotransferase [Desulfogranum mediterraneum]